MIQVAAALLYDEHGYFLIAQRAKGKLAGKWEFPGGKIEQGETPESAIVREIQEELGVIVVPKKIVGIFSAAHFGENLELILIKCTLSTNQHILSDGSHSSHAWVRIEDTEKYDFAPLDLEIIEFLKFPDFEKY